MEGQLFSLAAENGIWVALFVALFIYTILDSRNREKRYQETIDKNQEVIINLSNVDDDLKSIKNDTEFIRVGLERRM